MEKTANNLIKSLVRSSFLFAAFFSFTQAWGYAPDSPNPENINFLPDNDAAQTVNLSAIWIEEAGRILLAKGGGGRGSGGSSGKARSSNRGNSVRTKSRNESASRLKRLGSGDGTGYGGAKLCRALQKCQGLQAS